MYPSTVTKVDAGIFAQCRALQTVVLHGKDSFTSSTFASTIGMDHNTPTYYYVRNENAGTTITSNGVLAENAESIIIKRKIALFSAILYIGIVPSINISLLLVFSFVISWLNFVCADNTESTSIKIDGTTFFQAEDGISYLGSSNKSFGIKDVDVDNLDCKIFHIGYILLLDELDESDDEYGTKMAILLDVVQKKGIKTSIDAVSEEGDRFNEKIIPALKYCDYAIMNEIELQFKINFILPKIS